MEKEQIQRIKSIKEGSILMEVLKKLNLKDFYWYQETGGKDDGIAILHLSLNRNNLYDGKESTNTMKIKVKEENLHLGVKSAQAFIELTDDLNGDKYYKHIMLSQSGHVMEEKR